jgi:hypothetical protein
MMQVAGGGNVNDNVHATGDGSGAAKALAAVKGGAQALDEFGSIHAVAMATREELMSRLGAAAGVAIYQYFNDPLA